MAQEAQRQDIQKSPFILAKSRHGNMYFTVVETTDDKYYILYKSTGENSGMTGAWLSCIAIDSHWVKTRTGLAIPVILKPIAHDIVQKELGPELCEISPFYSMQIEHDGEIKIKNGNARLGNAQATVLSICLNEIPWREKCQEFTKQILSKFPQYQQNVTISEKPDMIVDIDNDDDWYFKVHDWFLIKSKFRYIGYDCDLAHFVKHLKFNVTFPYSDNSLQAQEAKNDEKEAEPEPEESVIDRLNEIYDDLATIEKKLTPNGKKIIEHIFKSIYISSKIDKALEARKKLIEIYEQIVQAQQPDSKKLQKIEAKIHNIFIPVLEKYRKDYIKLQGKKLQEIDAAYGQMTKDFKFFLKIPTLPAKAKGAGLRLLAEIEKVRWAAEPLISEEDKKLNNYALLQSIQLTLDYACNDNSNEDKKKIAIKSRECQTFARNHLDGRPSTWLNSVPKKLLFFSLNKSKGLAEYAEDFAKTMDDFTPAYGNSSHSQADKKDMSEERKSPDEERFNAVPITIK